MDYVSYALVLVHEVYRVSVKCIMPEHSSRVATLTKPTGPKG